MRALDDLLILSASDLANHLGCRHRTQLDLRVARRELDPPRWNDPALEVLQQLGYEHERRYVETLAAQGLSVLRIVERDGAAAATEDALRAGHDIVVQGTLARDHWLGRTDILRRVAGRSRFGAWSYEVYDTKLARETRAGTILQLCLYSDLLSEIQGTLPERFVVVTPGEPFDEQPYRVEDFLAYYRYVRGRLEHAAGAAEMPADAAYPEPTPLCDLCRWWPRCDRRWREDDHLSLVANLTRLQRGELERRAIATLARLASEPAPLTWRPRRGSADGLVRGREQARVQLEGRRTATPVHELLLPVVAGFGLTRLPEPSAGDLFLDLEGDAFVGRNGLEYLFGVAWAGASRGPEYRAWWGFDEPGERAAFEQLVDFMIEIAERHPGMHVYHYAPYEPGALKRLMGRYGTREDEIDRLLRTERFVDLYGVVRHAVRASVERYSIKDLEAFFGYTRDIALRDVAPHKRALEQALELGQRAAITPAACEAVERYNRDDCVSALRLRDWLEALRAGLERDGVAVPRPVPKEFEVERTPNERRQRARSLAAELAVSVAPVPSERTADEQARWLLAQLLEFHWREEKAVWWEHFRLIELDDEELLDDRAAIAGLEFMERVGGTAKKPVDRYRFAVQETDVRRGDDLKIACEGRGWGRVVAIEPAERTIDIEKTSRTAELHATAAYRHTIVPSVAQEESLIRLGTWVRDHGLDADGPHRAALDLLRVVPPRLHGGAELAARAGEDSITRACRTGLALDRCVLPIQGPPGAGKTFTGARMIVALVEAGRKIGITATSHKVIRNLLDEVLVAAAKARDGAGVQVACIQNIGSSAPVGGAVEEVTGNERVLVALANGTAQVGAGTTWMWAREEYAAAVDVLFVDEAGQMSLANVAAVAQAADSVVLLGDPRQLEQPIQGSHPDGAAVSALEHLLQGHATVPVDCGLFLGQTWRLAPPICTFTSEAFYEGRLHPQPNLSRHVLDGTHRFAGAGLWFVPVPHEGNQNSCPEEVDAVVAIVEQLLDTDTTWVDRHGMRRTLDPADILVVAPYNAHVARIGERLALRGIRVGTVDRFQGQEAPVVIYSLATSTPEEAPRGMEFLYSPNRFNVATSRAQCTCIVVASPRLFEPDCRSPRQMLLANAFCRYLELARTVELDHSA